jgi:hypothetical protein
MKKSPLLFAALAVLGVVLVIGLMRATPFGRADSTVELQAKFDGLQPGDSLTLEPNTYDHGAVLRITVPGVQINGNGATLRATDDVTSGVQILADNVSLSNLTLEAPPSGQRFSGLDQHKLLVRGSGARITDVTLNGSAAAGVFLYDAHDFVLDRVVVRRARADGIHMTNGSSGGRVLGAVTEWTGDDGVAVVSYVNEPPCHDIVVESPTVNGTTWGRGVTVVGGNDIAYRNVKVSQTNAGGVYVGNEGAPWFTGSVNRVQVTGGSVTGTNTNPDEVYGAVLVYSGNDGQSVNDVRISGLDIADTPSSAQRDVGIVVDRGSISGVVLDDIAVRNSDVDLVYVSPNVAPGSYTASGWTRDGAPVAAP